MHSNVPERETYMNIHAVFCIPTAGLIARHCLAFSLTAIGRERGCTFIRACSLAGFPKLLALHATRQQS
jgi:hypothetical protein